MNILLATLLTFTTIGLNTASANILTVSMKSAEKLANKIALEEATTAAAVTTKTVSKQFDAYDFIKNKHIQKIKIMDTRQQAELLFDVADGEKKSLSLMSKDSTALINNLKLTPKEILEWKKFALIGKNSKGRSVLITASPEKRLNDNWTHKKTLTIRVIKEIRDSELNVKPMYKEQALEKIKDEVVTDILSTLKKAHSSSGITMSKYLIFSDGISNKVILTRDSELGRQYLPQVMAVDILLDSSLLDAETLSSILKSLTK